MEAILFVGIQATGKTTFYRERFFKTHVRLSMDMLRTRHREEILVRACLEGKQPFVVDNTNPTKEERARYIAWAREHRFRVKGYYFHCGIEAALERNAARKGKERIPDVGIEGTYRKLETPTLDEGFDALHRVKPGVDGAFTVVKWQDEDPQTEL